MQRNVSWLRATLWLILSLVVVACHRNERLSANAGDAWSAVISAHTSGIVSRKSDIRVLFASDVLPETGKLDARSLLTIEPAVAGDIQFKGPRELSLTPSKD